MKYSNERVKSAGIVATLAALCMPVAAPAATAKDYTDKLDFGPHTPVVTKLADHAYSVWLKGYNTLVVIGDEGVLLTDPANNERAALLKQAIAKLTDKPVTKVVLSHEHFDHTGGTKTFPGADIIAQRNSKSIVGLDPLGLGVAPRDITTTFESDYVLEMGTTRVELRHMAAADGVANTVVYLPAEKIVVTADLYTGYGEKPALTPGEFLEDVNLLGSRLILNEIAGWDIKYALDSHSEAMDPALLRANADYLNDLYDAVFLPLQKAMATESSNASIRIWNLIRHELPGTIKLPKYEKWNNYDQLPDHVRRMGMAIIFGA